MYCYRLCLAFLTSPESWYQKIFNKELLSHFNEAYVPGTEIKETYNVSSVLFAESFFKEKKTKLYICSCGLKYEISLCEYPEVISNCLNCKEEIGGIYHSMVKREGHVCVVLNEESKEKKLYNDYETRKWGEKYDKKNQAPNNKMYEYYYKIITLKDLKQKAITQINNEATKGLQFVSYNFFKEENKSMMRQMNQISYRLLSLILYSLIHFGHMLNFITDSQLKTILDPKKTCIDYIKTNWILLVKELEKEKITNPYIFLNMIFSPDIKNILCRFPTFNTNEMRNNFESAITQFINSAVQQYSDFESQYKTQNENSLTSKKNSLNYILQETISPKEYI